MMDAEFWGDPISVYTREQAIEDGMLVEVPADLARDAGYRYQVVITAALQAVLAAPSRTEDYTGRLWDVLGVGMMMLRATLRRMALAGEVEAVTVTVPYRLTFSRRNHDVVLCLTVEGFTIGLPSDF